MTATIHLGTGHVPGGIAVSPDSSVVYVTDPTNGDVVAFDTATNAMITTFPANQAPFSVVASPDGTQLYVTNIGLNTVSVISV